MARGLVIGICLAVLLIDSAAIAASGDRPAAGGPATDSNGFASFTLPDPGLPDELTRSATADRELSALAALFHATGGGNWRENDGWLSGTDPGRWHGVTTDHLGRVIALELADNNLRGQIPASIAEFEHLREIVFDYNALSGTIPPQIGQLANLRKLELRRNALTGSLPTQIGNLTQLEVLALTDNNLSGPIPASVGGLAGLRAIVASHNAFTGPLPPELGKLRFLRTVSLESNQLSGELPSSLGDAFNLDYLRLSQNDLSGPIPDSFGKLASLTELSLWGNELTGPIPPSLGSLKQLQTLELSKNRLSGTIPKELRNAIRLRTLNVAGNELSGTIPIELTEMPALRWLALGNNRFEGAIPPELGNLSSLEFLHLSGNALSGTIPPELARPPGLRSLHLDRNQLTGPIPWELGSHRVLAYLTLHDNQLIGEIPRTFDGNADFEDLRLAGNKLTGCIPADLFLARGHDLAQLVLPRCRFGLVALDAYTGTLDPPFHGGTRDYLLSVDKDVEVASIAGDARSATVEYRYSDGTLIPDADPLAAGWQFELSDVRTQVQIVVRSLDLAEEATYRIRIVKGLDGRIRVVDNDYIQAPDNADLRHNVPDLEVVIGGRLVRADFLSHFKRTGAVKRWGYPSSEVIVLEPRTLTQFYQRGVVDFHDVGAGWVVERRLTWDYIGGGAGGSRDLGVEPGITNPNPGTLSGPWGHKVSNFAIDGTRTGFGDFYDGLGGLASFGYPKTDARKDTNAAGTLHFPGGTPGFIRQYFQAAILEFHPADRDFPVKISLIGDTLRGRLAPGWERQPVFAAAGRLLLGQRFEAQILEPAAGA